MRPQTANLQEELQRVCLGTSEQAKAKGSPHTLHTYGPLEDGCDATENPQTIERQKKSVAAMLDMDARDIEDLGELLQVLQESQKIKRPGHDEVKAASAKKARMESGKKGHHQQAAASPLQGGQKEGSRPLL